MNTQDIEYLTDLISRVQETGQPEIVDLDSVGILVFRNLYLQAQQAGLGAEILVRGKVYRVVKKI